jgi:hypothetical protein
MEFDATTLANALRGEEVARANLSATQAEYDRAQQLADRKNTGRTIFSALGNNAARARGRQQVSDLQPRLSEARKQAAETYGAKDLYSAELGADKLAYSRGRNEKQDALNAANTEYRQEQDTLNREWQEGAPNRALKLATNQQNLKKDNFSGSGTLYENLTTGDKITAFMTPSGPVDAAGSPISTDFTPVQSSGGSSGGGGRTAVGPKRDAVEHLNMRGAVDRIATTASSFNNDDHFELQSSMKRFKTKLALSLTPSQWEQFVEGEMKGKSDNIRNFLLQVRKLGARERNALFGSALTNTEYKSSETFSPAAQAVAMKEMMRRISLIDAEAVEGLENIDYVNKTGYGQKEYSALDEWEKEQKTPETSTSTEGLQTNANGWVLHEDAEGNQAYVNPNDPNQYEEVN